MQNPILNLILAKNISKITNKRDLQRVQKLLLRLQLPLYFVFDRSVIQVELLCGDISNVYIVAMTQKLDDLCKTLHFCFQGFHNRKEKGSFFNFFFFSIK